MHRLKIKRRQGKCRFNFVTLGILMFLYSMTRNIHRFIMCECAEFEAKKYFIAIKDQSTFSRVTVIFLNKNLAIPGSLQTIYRFC